YFSYPYYSYTFSLHDALPIFSWEIRWFRERLFPVAYRSLATHHKIWCVMATKATLTLPLHRKAVSYQMINRLFLCAFFYMIIPISEEHTSELQSRFDLVCRLL